LYVIIDNRLAMVIAMSKKSRSISIDADLDESLRKKDINVSSVVNRFLSEYLVGGDSAQVAKRMRIQDIEREIEDAQAERERLKRRIERLRDEREKLEREIEQSKEQRSDVVKEAYEQFGAIDDPNNPVVDVWSDKAEMSPERFIQALQEFKQ